ncbi:MAG: hypothetical protein JW780_03260 [Clostridiales bacterium]|nr:hypothetical protein [Clostridiales bacterium]
MKLINCPDQYIPYSFFDEMYAQRKQPEFGPVPSPWCFEIQNWSFMHADNRDLVPLDFADLEADDRDWETIRVPSVWQQGGYGSATYLQYDREIAEKQSKHGFIKRKIEAITSEYKDDDVGVYRSWVDIPLQYSERSVYLVLEGVCGRFELYLNGERIVESGPVFSPKKILLSKGLSCGSNLITLLVFRFESVSGGIGSFVDGTFGFSGIFRSIKIVADSLVEIRTVSVRTKWGGSEPGTEAYLDVRAQLFNQTDIPVPVKIEYKLIKALDEYDIYNLPEIRVRETKPCEMTIEAGDSVTTDSQLLARGVLPWSHATPYLYDLVMIIKDAASRVISVQKRRIGFRTVKETDGQVLINDIPVMIRATRYFSFDPQYGLSVPSERMLQDVILMKQAHINAVLMPHFPTDSQFFDLCDRYGLYVICPLDRTDIRAFAESFQTHPCVIVWSIKLHSREANRLEKIYQSIEGNSASDLIYHLFSDTGEVSDFDPFDPRAGFLFGEWQDLCLDRQFHRAQAVERETITTDEFALNSKGVRERDFRYIHQADLAEARKGKEVAIAQGMVDAFREKHPEYEDIRRRCETVRIMASEQSASNPVIVNTDLHGPTGDLELEWSLIWGVDEMCSGIENVGTLPPGAEKEISLGFIPEIPPETDVTRSSGTEGVNADPVISKKLILNARVCLSHPLSWAPEGYRESSGQFVLIDDPPARKVEVAEKMEQTVSVQEDASGIHVTYHEIQADISKEHGGITRLSVGDTVLIRDRSEPFFYRAATNAERYYAPNLVRPCFFSRKRHWRGIQNKIRLKKLEKSEENGCCCVRARYACIATKGPISVEYHFFPDGKLIIKTDACFRVKPPRFGLHLRIPKEADLIRWYGYGPGGLYAQEKWSPLLGLYKSHSGDLFHHYARPSENGAHKGSRFLEIIASDDIRLRIQRQDQPEFSFTASPYHPEDIDDCRHDEQLPIPDGAELFLDLEYEDLKLGRAEARQRPSAHRFQDAFVFEVVRNGGA